MLLILLGALLSALPVYLVLHNNIILAMILNALLVLVYSKVLTKENGTSIYTLIKITSILLVGLNGYLLYNEIFNKTKIIGLILALLSIILLS